MADDLTARLAALEARQAQLELTIAELQLQLDLRSGGFRSMRDSRRCPACTGEALLHVRAVSTLNGVSEVPLALAYDISVWTGGKPRGPLEAYACQRCGLVELHALSMETVPVDGTKIIAVEPETEPPRDGPFR